MDKDIMEDIEKYQQENKEMYDVFKDFSKPIIEASKPLISLLCEQKLKNDKIHRMILSGIIESLILSQLENIDDSFLFIEQLKQSIIKTEKKINEIQDKYKTRVE